MYSLHEISTGKNIFKKVAKSPSIAWSETVKVRVTQSWPTLWDPMDCGPPGSSLHGFLRQEYWSGLPFPSPGHLPSPGKEPQVFYTAGRLFPVWAPKKWDLPQLTEQENLAEQMYKANENARHAEPTAVCVIRQKAFRSNTSVCHVSLNQQCPWKLKETCIFQKSV